MFKLDDQFLQDVGLGSLPQDQKAQMLNDIYDRLELQVGMRLAEQMTDEQLDEFEAVIDQKNDQASQTWLETNFPSYRQVVADELEKLKNEIRENAAKIMEVVSGAIAQDAGQAQPPQVT